MDGFLRCPVCGARARDRVLRSGQELRCVRCASTIKRPDRRGLAHAAWAAASTGLVLGVLANVYPILTFEVAGRRQSTGIMGGVEGLLAQGYWPVAALVFFCASAAPLIHIGLVWYAAGSLSGGGKWPLTGGVVRLVELVAPWSLIPVFAVACGVASVKLDMLGSVHWESGMLWVALLALCSFVLSRIFDVEDPVPDR